MASILSSVVPPLDVTRDLLLKHDKPGPRYTSYPTAPEWDGSFGDTQYREALARAAQAPEDPLSIYVHLPFCYERCLFCGCNVVISKRHEVSDKYLEYLFREIKMAAAALAPRRTVKQLHWGGGTPTYLDVGQIRQLFGVLAEQFSFAPDAEIALEVDPRITTHEQLSTLRELGFNRISMGVQDLDPKVQTAIGREQTEDETRRIFTWCRDLGFLGVNIDLIYGLPEQSPAGWENTIRAVIDIHPDRLAVYSYAHLPNMIKHQKKLEGMPRPVGPEKYDLFALARRLFLEHGYRAIGMDHFALPTDELSAALDERRLHRNFMGYTVVPGGDMIGFGTSAIGEIGGAYAQNEKRPVLYYHALDEGRFPTMTGITLTEDDTIRRWTIRQLMCNFYLEFRELKRRFGVSYDDYFQAEEQDLGPFYRDHFLERTPEALRVLPLGQVFVRNVCMVFDAYLRKPESHRQFSRTV
ncbi:MAG: oxygen-independent coproporphyrinogen III oxidase [Candidatus Hydrogenedentes bacterium]|nr:oxygen-independent coproporphyrinogen III oxidase [Candidatus Hydrogenedentota bacterium]